MPGTQDQIARLPQRQAGDVAIEQGPVLFHQQRAPAAQGHEGLRRQPEHPLHAAPQPFDAKQAVRAAPAGIEDITGHRCKMPEPGLALGHRPLGELAPGDHVEDRHDIAGPRAIGRNREPLPQRIHLEFGPLGDARHGDTAVEIEKLGIALAETRQALDDTTAADIVETGQG